MLKTTLIAGSLTTLASGHIFSNLFSSLDTNNDGVLDKDELPIATVR